MATSLLTPTLPKSTANQERRADADMDPHPSISRTPGGRNVLAEDIEVIGTVTFADNLTIEGKILGDVFSKGDLTVGEHAVIKGNIQARSAIIYGRIEGNISVDGRCEAGSTATILGDISALTFSIKEGAALTGRSRIGKSAVSKA